ncbi:MAG: hypothetical protein ACOX0H_02685 [Patescibacteria group bacterium]|nr:hypothetical protein [bacterium]HQC50156.1 hypothetical protein [bacterium]
MNLVKCFLVKSKVITDLNLKLEKLEKEMKTIKVMDNKVEAIVRLFQVIAPLYDEGGFRQEIFLLTRIASRRKKKQIEALQVLQMHIRRAGRSKYGMNRTAKGESITSGKVFLGGIYGLWTKTADYWLSEKEQLEKDFREDLTRNPEYPISTWYLINDCQCGTFVEDHAEGILREIESYRAA